MFSNLAPSHAPTLISHVTDHNVPGIWANWRGRYGLTESAQAELWNAVDPTRQSTSDSWEVHPAKATAKEAYALRFKTWEGEVVVVKGKEGETLLDIARKNDLPSMEGTCGGNLGQ